MKSSNNGSLGTMPQKPVIKALVGLRYEHLLAGVCGGIASTVILHPLDLMKIRFAGWYKLA